MTKTDDEIIALNRAAWDASAKYHREAARFQVLLDGFARGGYSCLDAIETAIFQSLGVAGKDVAQLCCNNGRELLSVKTMGAARCVGFDQSARFLDQAHELAAAAGGIEVEFLETDVNKIGAAFDASFDLVYVTIGVLTWMPDLNRFISVAARLLRPGGAFSIYEQHPIMGMFEPWSKPDPFKPVDSYFRKEPFIEVGPIVYDGARGQEGTVSYCYIQTLGDVFTACLAQGLRIEHFREYPHNISSEEWDIYDNQPAQLPQSYTLIARKVA
jgi:SAM-dependent methyltransferase